MGKKHVWTLHFIPTFFPLSYFFFFSFFILSKIGMAAFEIYLFTCSPPAHATHEKRKIGIITYSFGPKDLSRYRDNGSRQFKLLPLGLFLFVKSYGRALEEGTNRIDSSP